MTDKNPLVIGIVGPAGSGKSTVAQYLVEKYGAKRYSLAAPLKEIAKRTLDFTDEQMYGTQAQKEAIDPRYGFSARHFLQRLGTEGVRTVLGEDFWPKVCADLIEKDFPPIAVIDDMRFVSEAELFQFRPHLDARIWRLWPVGDAESTARAAAAGQHASERQWLDITPDTEIKPTVRGLDELHAWIDIAMCADLTKRVS